MFTRWVVLNKVPEIISKKTSVHINTEGLPLKLMAGESSGPNCISGSHVISNTANQHVQ